MTEGCGRVSRAASGMSFPRGVGRWVDCMACTCPQRCPFPSPKSRYIFLPAKARSSSALPCLPACHCPVRSVQARLQRCPQALRGRGFPALRPMSDSGFLVLSELYSYLLSPRLVLPLVIRFLALPLGAFLNALNWCAQKRSNLFVHSWRGLIASALVR